MCNLLDPTSERFSSEDDLATLGRKDELESFVCEGEYEHGLQRILDSYTGHRNRTTQPAVWVSGFYGSGKSHLVRVLQAPVGRHEVPERCDCARRLANTPQGIQDQLTELTTLDAPGWCRVVGGRKALDRSGDALNSVFLSIVLGAAGLPACRARSSGIVAGRQRAP